MKAMKLMLLVWLFTNVMCSCKITAKITLATDDYLSNSDDLLIKKGMSDKEQHYIFPKSLYQNSERKKSLKTINDLCKTVLGKYRAGAINKAKYNQFSNNAKLVVQHAMYMMGSTPVQTGSSDAVNAYLQTGIRSLNTIINN